MRRLLVNFLTVLSLLACAAVVALWFRGFWRYDLIAVEGGGAGIIMGSYRGHLLWTGRAAWEDPNDTGRPGRLPRLDHESGDADDSVAAVWDDIRTNASWRLAGFSYTLEHASRPPLRILITPSWFLAVLFAALPARKAWLLGTRRRRGRHGLCPSCGYDLRATPGRCPECGREVAPSRPALETSRGEGASAKAHPSNDSNCIRRLTSVSPRER
jgi:hypothetical protein